jgi:beta-lactamase superfamily II metal-dependent hydrolase
LGPLHYNKGDSDTEGGDGLYILAPTTELIATANEIGDFNDSSYVILYRAINAKIIFAGDSHDKTWEYILDNHEDDVKDVDLLIAPHHGRKSDRCYDFLDVLHPKLTFFGNANAEHLAYDAWNRRKLRFVTNNQANCMIVDADDKNESPSFWVTNEAYAKEVSVDPFYSERLKAYYCYTI